MRRPNGGPPGYIAPRRQRDAGRETVRSERGSPGSDPVPIISLDSGHWNTLRILRHAYRRYSFATSLPRVGNRVSASCWFVFVFSSITFSPFFFSFFPLPCLDISTWNESLPRNERSFFFLNTYIEQFGHLNENLLASHGGNISFFFQFDEDSPSNLSRDVCLILFNNAPRFKYPI